MKKRIVQTTTNSHSIFVSLALTRDFWLRLPPTSKNPTFHPNRYTSQPKPPTTPPTMAHALVFGASGISGWALLNQLRSYPTPSTFSKITGLSNRPLSLSQAQLPEDDTRYQLISGIDLTKSVNEVVALLQEKVAGVQGVTHVFFTAYIQTGDFESLKKVNTELLRVAVEAIEQVAPGLKTVVLQTGGKGYVTMSMSPYPHLHPNPFKITC